MNGFSADDLKLLRMMLFPNSKIFFPEVAARQMFDIHNMFTNYKQLPDGPDIKPLQQNLIKNIFPIDIFRVSLGNLSASLQFSHPEMNII